MDKTAQTDAPILPLLAERWSPRSFDPREIDQETLDSLFEAARWSASSMNAQPWRYRYAFRGSPEFDNIIQCLHAGNQIWAQNAAVLIVSSAHMLFPHNDQPNGSALHDVGMANGQMVLEAQSRGIYTRMMGGFSPEKLTNLIDFPKNEQPVCVIAMGYRGPADELNDEFKKRELAPRVRHRIEDFTQEL